jgi:hypothetical protein
MQLPTPSLAAAITARKDRDSTRGTCPPQWVLDKIADKKFSGGWNIRRSNTCLGCFQVYSVNGTCGC